LSSQPDQGPDLLQPLANYAAASPRSALQAIDEAVIAALADPARTNGLAKKLGTQLRTNISPEAKRFLCSKLLLLGSDRAVLDLALQLTDPAVECDARAALEAVSSPAADKVLRDALPRLTGNARLGAITSLGARRDERAVKVLAREFASADPGLAGAAADAVARIGTEQAGKALLARFCRLDSQAQEAWADALLLCAEQLHDGTVRRELLAQLRSPSLPAHVHIAAARLAQTQPQSPSA
jgi:HEAT repeat protein